MDAVEKAKQNQMKVFMGAPNLIRGFSSNGNLRALDIVAHGACDGLVSDYYPECLVQAPFIASKSLSLNLNHTLPLVTSQPGSYLKTHSERGLLVPGAPADLIVVDTSGLWTSVTQTWVGGVRVYSSRSLEKG
jgi:alpha-D-ribose 1-methylphosphonate 5-triphosphate diphosphatase